MPLDRTHITVASRVMLPVHIAFSTLLGTAWTLQNPGRTAVPALAALRGLWPIQGTGLVLIGVGLIALAGVLTGHRAIAGLALGTGCLTYLILAGFVTAPIFTGTGSASAPLWPLYVAFAHFASMLSIAFDEGSPERNR